MTFIYRHEKVAVVALFWRFCLKGFIIRGYKQAKTAAVVIHENV